MQQRTFLIILISIFISTFINAQQNFKPGYIIDHLDQKTEGQVLFTDPISIHDKIQFKHNGKIATYSPSDIKVFKLGKKDIYRSYEIPLLDDRFLNTGETDLKFLKTIASGAFDVYLLVNKGTKTFYYSKDQQNIFPIARGLKKVNFERPSKNLIILESGLHIDNPENGFYSSKNKRYEYFYDGSEVFLLTDDFQKSLAQLKGNANCSNVKISSDFKPSTASLKNFAESVHECTNQKDKFKGSSTKLNFQLSTLGTAGYNTKLKEEYGIPIGYYIELRANNLSPSVSIGFANNWYSTTNSELHGTFFNYDLRETEVYYNKINIRESIVRLSYHLKPGKNFRPYASFGFMERRFRSKETGETSGDIAKIEDNYRYHLLFAGGIDYYFSQFNQIRLEAHYTNALGITIGYGIYFD